MKKYYPYKQICSLLSLIIIITCCNSRNKTNESAGASKTIPAALPIQVDESTSTHEINNSDGDPSFVMPLNIISTHGPRSITRNILQDKNGNYWFATWEGIVHYDGKLFTNITLKEGLKHFHVFSLLEDKTGNLWFGTIGGGVYRYNGKSFTNFSTNEGLADNSVMCMLDDKTGNIWFATGNGVSRCRYDGYTFINFKIQNGLRGNFVSTIVQDKTGKLWFGTNGGISYYTSTSFSQGDKYFSDFKNKEGINFANVRSIIEDKSGNIWIGSQEGLHHYNPVLGGLTNLTKSFPGNVVLEDKKGNLWLSEGKADGMALYRYYPSEALITDSKSLLTVPAGFTKITSNNNQIFGVTEDRDGNIWFGTVHGVCRYSVMQYSGEGLTREVGAITEFTEK